MLEFRRRCFLFMLRITLQPPRSNNDLSRGGFGIPQQKNQKPLVAEKKFKRSSEKKDDIAAKSLDVGDFQTAIMKGNASQVQQYLKNGKTLVNCILKVQLGFNSYALKCYSTFFLNNLKAVKVCIFFS